MLQEFLTTDSNKIIKKYVDFNRRKLKLPYFGSIVYFKFENFRELLLNLMDLNAQKKENQNFQKILSVDFGRLIEIQFS
jgi:hypothetical protein